jgi:hypothetical protein
MIRPRHVSAKEGDCLVLVGTTKGAFVLRSGPARSKWDIGGPYFPGLEIYSLAYDGRGERRRIWAGTMSHHWGPFLAASDDFGRTWTEPGAMPVGFPDGLDAAVKRIWQIRPGPASQPEVLYCGVEPAALFQSRDAGKSWHLVRGLWDHPHRPKWQPGGGGLCLHTIVPDPTNPKRLFIAISTAGVYRTDDGGKSWRTAHRGVRAQFLPDPHPEFGQCVHKVVMHPSHPERLFLQNHWGLYRSDDAGDSWQDIANGVPSDFGFAMAMHPHDPETVYIAPIDSDEFRVMPEGRLRVYRTRNAGRSWEPLTEGLPQENALELVLRDAMDTDPMNPAGVYFGTANGQIFGSPNGGASWSEIHRGLPRVLCVRAAVVGEPKRVPPLRGAVKVKKAAKPGARTPARAARPSKRK